jgi:hypothetical protein
MLAIDFRTFLFHYVYEPNRNMETYAKSTRHGHTEMRRFRIPDTADRQTEKTIINKVIIL